MWNLIYKWLLSQQKSKLNFLVVWWIRIQQQLIKIQNKQQNSKISYKCWLWTVVNSCECCEQLWTVVNEQISFFRLLAFWTKGNTQFVLWEMTKRVKKSWFVSGVSFMSTFTQILMYSRPNIYVKTNCLFAFVVH